MARWSEYSGTTLGSSAANGIAILNKAMKDEVQIFVSHELTLRKVLPMILRDDDIAKAKAAHEIVIPQSSLETYRIGSNHSLGCTFKDARMCTIDDTRLFIQPERTGELEAYVRAVTEIYLKYEAVKGAFRWLNKHATLTAMRFYFPAAMQLVPEQFVGMSETPTRYAVPHGVEDWSQILRDASNTVAAIALMPNIQRKSREEMWLTIDTREVRVSENIKYSTDSVTFDI